MRLAPRAFLTHPATHTHARRRFAANHHPPPCHLPRPAMTPSCPCDCLADSEDGGAADEGSMRGSDARASNPADDLDDAALADLLGEFNLLDDGVEDITEMVPVPTADVAERDDALPARALASRAECDQVHRRLHHVLPPAAKNLRFAQARHLAATQDGADAVLIAATGSGKSLNMFVHAAADFADAVAAGTHRDCRPIDLVLIPMVNMGPAHEQAARRFFGSPHSDAVPAALYVARDSLHNGRTDGSSRRIAQNTGMRNCPSGHTLLWHPAYNKRALLDSVLCDVCGDDLGPTSGRWACANRTLGPGCDYDVCAECQRGTAPDAPSAVPSPSPLNAAHSPRTPSTPLPPLSIPCGVCDACTNTSFSRAKKSKLLHGCNYSCHVAVSRGEVSDKCAGCRRAKGGLRDCVRRSRLPVASQSVGVVGGTPHSAGEGSDGAAASELKDAPPPPRLDALPHSSAEWRVAFDPSVVLVICTWSALHSHSERSALLHDAIARRGVRRLFLDEVHTLSTHMHGASMATFSAALHTAPDIIDRIIAGAARRRHPRPSIVGLTSTLPPAVVPHVCARARIAEGARVVRCAIDRPELQHIRLALPPRLHEKLLHWGQRILCHLHELAPSWALSGSIVVFCPTARFASRAQANYSMPHPAGGRRKVFLFLGVEKMTSVQRREAMDGLESSPGAILLTNEAWSHGAGVAGITMVVHLALPKGPVELAQRSGRAARCSGEKGLVVYVVAARMLVQRMLLCKPEDRGSHIGAQQLLQQLTCEGCLRASFLRHLGQGNVAQPCGACDACHGCSSWSSQPLGALPGRLRRCIATAAALALFEDWDVDTVSLSRLLRQPAATAPPPFHLPEAHDALVGGLLAEKTIRYDAVAGPHSYGSFALCSLDQEAVEAYRHGHRTLEVLLDVSAAGSPRDLTPGDASNCASQGALADDAAGSEAAVAAAYAIRSNLDVARTAVERARRTLSQGLRSSFRKRLLSELHLDPVARSLLSAVDATTTLAPPLPPPVPVCAPGSTAQPPDAEQPRKRPRLRAP